MVQKEIPIFKKICTEIKNIGKPEYHPTYMIQHGMGAFLNNGDNGLIKNFNSDSAWSLVLTGYDCLN